jgi:hypothetical protein
MDLLEIYGTYGIAGVIATMFVYWIYEQFKNEKFSRQKLSDTVDALQLEIRQNHKQELIFREQVIRDLYQHNEKMVMQTDKILQAFNENQKLIEKFNK